MFLDMKDSRLYWLLGWFRGVRGRGQGALKATERACVDSMNEVTRGWGWDRDACVRSSARAMNEAAGAFQSAGLLRRLKRHALLNLNRCPERHLNLVWREYAGSFKRRKQRKNSETGYSSGAQII